jgi:hypothetical protein
MRGFRDEEFVDMEFRDFQSPDESTLNSSGDIERITEEDDVILRSKISDPSMLVPLTEKKNVTHSAPTHGTVASSTSDAIANADDWVLKSSFIYCHVESVRIRYTSHFASFDPMNHPSAETKCVTNITFQLERISLVGSIRQSIFDRTLEESSRVGDLNLPYAQLHFCVNDVTGVHSHRHIRSSEMRHEYFLRFNRDAHGLRDASDLHDSTAVCHASIEIPFRSLLSSGLFSLIFLFFSFQFLW